MPERAYLHGYDGAEQARLVAQADYWRTMLVPHGLAYRPGDRVLDVGCGVGAVLGVLADAFPGIRLAGIDREPRQIEFARAHLAAHPDADLRVGDAERLPWPDDTFDHVYTMWFLEHMTDPAPVLREALRVLSPGGRIACTEMDYTAFKVLPESEGWDALEAAQLDWFARHGSPLVARRLGPLLVDAGFEDVASAPVGFHFFADGSGRLAAHVAYVAAFLAPTLPAMADALGADLGRLERGLAHLRRLPDLPGASMTQIVYRAHGAKRGA